MNNTQVAALQIGRTIRDARLDSGFKSRASLVGTKKLKGKLTQEGLRKIEAGERVPRLENLHLIAQTLGIGPRKTKELEKLALKTNIQRVTKRAGNATVTFSINGSPVRVEALPPRRKTEAFVRESVNKLVEVVQKYGVMPEDIDHFRRHARSILLQQLS